MFEPSPDGVFARRVVLPWVCYLAFFVGVSFQSGGIVHYSLNPAKYGLLIGFGAVIFLIGAIAQDLLGANSILRRGGARGFFPFIFFSLMLSVGVGMIGGGVQHFEDLGERAPLYLSFGLFFSILGFLGRFKPHRHAKEAAGAIGIGTLLALLTFAAVAPNAVVGAGHDDGHTEAEAEVTVSTSSPTSSARPSADESSDDHSTLTERTTASATVAPEVPVASTAADGHTDDDHS